MPRDEASARAQQLLLTALGSTPGLGMAEGTLRRMTDLSQSLFQEAMQALTATKQVVVSQGDGNKNHTEYHLVQQQRQVSREGPLSPLAVTVLARLHSRAEGARAVSKALEVELSLVQSALDELEAAGQVSRSQVGMLVIYRGTGSVLRRRHQARTYVTQIQTAAVVSPALLRRGSLAAREAPCGNRATLA